MRRSLALLGIHVLFLGTAAPVRAQIASFPTPPPLVTAEQSEWYLSGDPIVVGGIIYFPSGPVRHFDRDEMVQTGTFDGVPIYIKPTREPRSVIYVPLSGGLVRPFEQRRAGDLAGTTGSVPPRYPVVLPAEERDTIGGRMPRAAAPPTGVPVGAFGTTAPPAEETLGRHEVAPESAATRGTPAERTTAPQHVQIGPRPTGLNAVFVEYDNRRWVAAGAAVALNPAFRQVGQYAGFPVYTDPARPDLIYLPVESGRAGLVSPYQAR